MSQERIEMAGHQLTLPCPHPLKMKAACISKLNNDKIKKARLRIELNNQNLVSTVITILCIAFFIFVEVKRLIRDN